MIIENKESNFERIKTPTGLQHAVCSQIIDIGLQRTFFNGEDKVTHKMIILFELEKRIEVGDFNGQRYLVSKKYTVSLHEKATLLKDLNSWRGKAMTDDDKKHFDTDKLVGVNCFLNLMEKEKHDGGSFIEIASISPVPSGVVLIKPEYKETPKWIQALIDSQVKPEEKKPEEDIF